MSSIASGLITSFYSRRLSDAELRERWIHNVPLTATLSEIEEALNREKVPARPSGILNWRGFASQ